MLAWHQEVWTSLENRKATGKSNAEMMLHLVVTIWCTESPYDIQFYWFSVMDSP